MCIVMYIYVANTLFGFGCRVGIICFFYLLSRGRIQIQLIVRKNWLGNHLMSDV